MPLTDLVSSTDGYHCRMKSFTPAPRTLRVSPRSAPLRLATDPIFSDGSFPSLPTCRSVVLPALRRVLLCSGPPHTAWRDLNKSPSTSFNLHKARVRRRAASFSRLYRTRAPEDLTSCWPIKWASVMWRWHCMKPGTGFSLRRGGSVSVLDTQTGKELTSLLIGPGGDDLAFSSASKRLNAPSGGGG
jgi:hypothetical protein